LQGVTTSAPSRPRTARSTTIALKVLMAGTGLVFVGFVLAHMYGNLMALGGERAFNTYAEHLRTFGEPMLPRSGFLWVLRIALILALVGHVYAAFALWARANGARSQRYAVKKAVFQSFSSKWMRWGGVFILLFLVWHLLQFTIVKIDVSGAGVTDNPYRLVVNSFQTWWLTLIYVLAMLALYMHLAHGVFSATQTLGWTQTARAHDRSVLIGHLVAAFVVVGFLIPPLAILFRLVK
jgi:succinate dehydrogenase / fumarate reductase cytochrome b subunit